MKLNARWIEESRDELCLRCGERKGGRFLIVDLLGKKYAAFCEGCLMGGKVDEREEKKID